MSDDETIDDPVAMLNRRKQKARLIVTDEIAAEILERLRDGEMLTDIERSQHIPRASVIAKHRRDNPEFDAAFASALADCADANLHDAATFARVASASGDVDDARTAEIYARSILAINQQLSPKTHGALIKHAGADGGVLTVMVTNYAKSTGDETGS